MNAKQARKLRKLARQYTPHLPEVEYRGEQHGRFESQVGVTQSLGECTRGAYKALKTGSLVDKRATA